MGYLLILLYLIIWIGFAAAAVIAVIYFIGKRRKEKVEEKDIVDNDDY